MFSIWFMFDNHTFAKVINGDRASLIRQGANLFSKDGCGSLFVKDEWGGSMEKLTLHGRMLTKGRYGVTDAALEQWADDVLSEISFRKTMAA